MGNKAYSLESPTEERISKNIMSQKSNDILDKYP